MRWWTVPALWRASRRTHAIFFESSRDQSVPSVAQEDIFNLQPMRTSLNGLGRGRGLGGAERHGRKHQRVQPALDKAGFVPLDVIPPASPDRETRARVSWL